IYGNIAGEGKVATCVYMFRGDMDSLYKATGTRSQACPRGTVPHGDPRSIISSGRIEIPSQVNPIVFIQGNGTHFVIGSGDPCFAIDQGGPSIVAPQCYIVHRESPCGFKSTTNIYTSIICNTYSGYRPIG